MESEGQPRGPPRLQVCITEVRTTGKALLSLQLIINENMENNAHDFPLQQCVFDQERPPGAVVRG